MKARTHDLAAITALGVVVMAQPDNQFSLGTVVAAIFANQLGGIAPDIDQPVAPLWRNLPIGGLFGKIAGKMLGGHRFITHSIVGLVLFGLLARLFLTFIHPIIPAIDIEFVWWAFMIGMVSHLIMDSFTKEGVPWLLPIPIKFGVPPIKHWRITTGTWREGMFFIALAGFDLWYCAAHYRDIIQLLHQRIG